MTKLKKIGVLSAAKIYGLCCTLMGLLLGLIFALFGSVFSSIMQASGAEVSGMLVGGLGAIIIMPIMYGIFGFVGGAIGAFIYNLIAGWIGGIEIELENK